MERCTRSRVWRAKPGGFPVESALALVLRDVVRCPGFVMPKIWVPANIEGTQGFGLVVNIMHFFREGVMTR